MNLLFLPFIFLFSLEYSDVCSQNYSVIENPSDVTEGIENDSYLARCQAIVRYLVFNWARVTPISLPRSSLSAHLSKSLSPSLPHCSSIINLSTQWSVTVFIQKEEGRNISQHAEQALNSSLVY